VCLFSLASFGQTLNVHQFGAIGDGVSDDTVALQNAINSTPAGGTLSFSGSSVYSVNQTIYLQPGRSYTGPATLRFGSGAPAGQALLSLRSTQPQNVTVDGISLDASGLGGGFDIDFMNQSNPAVNIIVQNLTIQNTRAIIYNQTDHAFYVSLSLVNSRISNVTFQNCGGAIWIANAQALTIDSNVFDTISFDDAIFLAFYTASYDYGKNLVITNNRFRTLSRMGIEVWGDGATKVIGTSIANNIMSGWTPFMQNQFGISMVTGTQASIVNNTLLDGVGSYGMELGAPASVVQGNYIQGFDTGLELYGTSGSSVVSNYFIAQSYEGIDFSNDSSSKSNVTVVSNTIANPGSVGIFTNTSNWAGTQITGNVITRNGGLYPSDAGMEFNAIGLTPPSGPVNVSGNTIIQGATNPPANFTFIGLHLNGNSGSNAGSHYDFNVMLSKSVSPNGIGIVGNSSGSLDNAFVTKNVLQNLNTATAGGPSPNVIIGGNQVISCVQQGPIVLLP
jgi:hypothetical protein